MSFLQEYFINPILHGTGYNLVNTLTYGLILVLALNPLLRLLKRWQVRFDKGFYLAMLPFLLGAPTVRVLVDAGIYSKDFIGFGPLILSPFMTPGIYITFFVPALISIGLGHVLAKRLKTASWKVVGALGILTFGLIHAYKASGALQVQLHFQPFVLLIVALSTFLACGLFYWVTRYWKQGFWRGLPLALVYVHLYDAASTYAALGFDWAWPRYGLVEQHVVGGFLIDLIGPTAMFPLKLAVVPLVVWMLSQVEDKQERGLYYFVVFTLGFGPGTRNVLRVLIGV